MRDLKDEKIATLLVALGTHKEKVELVEADLLNPDSIYNAFREATYVIHSACPMPLTPPSFEEVKKTIVDGTMTVLKACEELKVSRLVFTSHYGAITNVDELDRPDLFDE